MNHADKIEVVKTYLTKYLPHPIRVRQEKGEARNTYFHIGTDYRVVASDEFFRERDVAGVARDIRRWQLASQVRDDGRGRTFLLSKSGVRLEGE